MGSCKKDPCCKLIPGPSLNYIDLNNLSIGQKSKYLLLWGEEYRVGDGSNYFYLDDTLILEVVAKDPQKGFMIEERFHYLGDVYTSWLEDEKDDVFQYFLKVSQDTLSILPVTGSFYKSRIFKSEYNGLKLPLAPIDQPEAQILGWFTNLSYCACNTKGFVKNYTQFGRIFPKLNLVVNNWPMASDGPGATFLYGPSEGFVRFSYYSAWTGSGYGFDLLP
ncbi:MAG TPA: hypothetical protein DCF33_14630 [Saprospirales bacterium]|nr:hypothetical protein [Saprospirales bacterium]